MAPRKSVPPSKSYGNFFQSIQVDLEELGPFHRIMVVTAYKGYLIHHFIFDTIKCITSCESETANLSGRVKTVYVKQLGLRANKMLLELAVDWTQT